jgi:shikimate kinase
MLIFIIGYMGAGKTTLGVQIASRLGYRFLDLDELIVSETGCTIVQLFEQSGEEAFRIKEREILLKHLDDMETVIAAGGGAPCYSDNLDLMNRKGITVFMDTPVETIVARIKAGSCSRPLLKGVADDKLEGFIKKHLESRMKFYSQAQIRVTGTPLSDAVRSSVVGR